MSGVRPAQRGYGRSAALWRGKPAPPGLDRRYDGVGASGRRGIVGNLEGRSRSRGTPWRARTRGIVGTFEGRISWKTEKDTKIEGTNSVIYGNKRTYYFRGAQNELVFECKNVQTNSKNSTKIAKNAGRRTIFGSWIEPVAEESAGCGTPPPGSLCDSPSLRVIPRSSRRRGISHCLENTQSEIPRSARNDSIGGVSPQPVKPRPSAFIVRNPR